MTPALKEPKLSGLRGGDRNTAASMRFGLNTSVLARARTLHERLRVSIAHERERLPEALF
jgi:hypothetical protein